MLPLLPAAGGTRRDPAWHVAVEGLVAAEMPRELRRRDRIDFHTISCRDAPK